MKPLIKDAIKILVVFAVITVFEFALPITTYSAGTHHTKQLIAKRDFMGARIIMANFPERDMCKIRSCGPTYEVKKSLQMRVTAYSSTPDQTSGNPFITASGTHVHDGTFAMNGIPFGTKLRIPEYFGDKIFIVEDRMHSRYSSYRGDIWMHTRSEAIQWGARTVYVEIVEEK